MIRKISYFFLISFMIIAFWEQSFSQNLFEGGQVSGSFQTDVHAYVEDSIIGATTEKINGEKLGMNGFANIQYTLGKFKAGIRYETYLKPLVGYLDDYQGSGIAHRYISFKQDNFEVTAGHFYEQFGNGLIFRSYDEWNLGYDNAMDGLNVRFSPANGIMLKGVYGIQRAFWKKYKDEEGNITRAIVRGFDAEFALNDLFKSMQSSDYRLTLGASFVSKYQKDDEFSLYKLPENVGSWAGRFNLGYKTFNLIGEYAEKINDPHTVNNFIYKDGHSAFLTASYYTKGLGVSVSAKRIDNFSFKSDRNIQPTKSALDINFLPPLAKEHSYSLAAYYPYATQPNGEIGISGQIIYTIPKKSKLGGKYGTTLTLNYSNIHNIKKEATDDETAIMQAGTLGYKSDFLAWDELFFEDITFEVAKKVNRKYKFNFLFSKIQYNKDVLEHPGDGMVDALVFVLDNTFKLSNKDALRLEAQYMNTEQDLGSWAMGTAEYSIAPKWFFALSDQYSMKQEIHFYNAAMGYTMNTTRFMMSYGRQREGILCVGGVCRQVPAATGFKLTVTSSF